MSDFAIEFLPTLGRTTGWLILAGLTTAAILRLARANWPTAHRIGWVVTIAVGWTFLRLPVAIPWYDATPSKADSLARATSTPRPTIGPFAITASPAGAGTGPVVAASEIANPDSQFDISPGKAFPGLDDSEEVSTPLRSRFDWPLAVLFIWALGIVGLAAAWLVGYLRFVRSLPSGMSAEQAWLDQWKQLLAAAGVRRSIPLRVTADLGPMLCRLPRGYELLVPADLWRELEIGQRGAILRHELAHYLRGDVWKSLAVRLLALPHWFNPVSWWAVRRFEEAAEWACDRAATAEEPPTTYAKALVLLGASAAGPVAYGSAARGPALAVRIRRLLNLQAKEDSTMKKTLLVAAGLCLTALPMVRLQLVAMEPGAAEELVAETVELNDADADPQPNPSLASAEQTKPAAPAAEAVELQEKLEAVQLQKRLVAEQLADTVSQRSRLIGGLSRIRLQIKLAEPRKKNPDEARSLEAAVEDLVGQDRQIAQASDRVALYHQQLADEAVKGVPRDDPRMKALLAKIKNLEQKVEDRKATLRPQLKEQLAANSTNSDQPITPMSALEKEKEFLQQAIEEAEKIVKEKSLELQKLEKFSAEVVAQHERSVQRAAIGAQAVEARGESAAAAEAAGASAVTEAAQKMVGEAHQAFDAMLAAFEAETTRLEPVYEWSLRWMNAVERVAANNQQRVEAVRAHLERMRQLHKKIDSLYRVGTKGGEFKEWSETKFYVAEAERHLAEVLAENAAGGVKDAEMQILDLKIKIAELEGQLEETRVQLNADMDRLNTKPGNKIVPESNLRQLREEIAKLQAHQQSLRKQLELYKNKLQLSERAASTPDSTKSATTAVERGIQWLQRNASNSDTAPAAIAPAKAKNPAPPAAETTSQSSKAKRGPRYDGKDFNAWVAELRDDLSPVRRKEAIQALATFGANGYGPQAAEEIIETMRSYSFPITMGIVENKTAEGGYAVSHPGNNPVSQLAAAALYAFQKISPDDASPAVMKALKSDNANQRLFAVAVLRAADPGSRAALPILIETLKDPDLRVRQRAMLNIAARDPASPALIPVLRETLASDDEFVVREAIHIVGGSWGPVGLLKPHATIPALVPELVGSLKNPNSLISDMASQALLQIGEPAIPALEKAINAEGNPPKATKTEEILKLIRERAAKEQK